MVAAGARGQRRPTDGPSRDAGGGRAGSASATGAAAPVDGDRRRAARRPAAGDARRVEFGPYWVDFRTWQARTRQGVVELSRKELAVLKLLVERPHEVVSRRELLAEVWELPNHPNTRVVDNVIVSLRRAFETDAAKPRHILSARGVGYRFVP